MTRRSDDRLIPGLIESGETQSVGARDNLKLVIDWPNADNRLTQDVPPIPELPGLAPKEKAIRLANWERSNAGLFRAAALDEAASYPFAVAADGTFHIDDVKPGTYSLVIAPWVQGKRIPIARAEIQVVVPGNINGPLDVGIVVVKPVAQ